MVVEVGSVPKTGQKNAYPRDNLYPTARSLPVCAGAHASLSLPLSAAIDLREIHLARQSSLQVPVGHITVPGGIKLCSPGTFLVANYLIINNGSCQVNFTKPNRATIDTPTHSGSARMPLRHLWARLPCRRPVRSPPSPRRDATDVPVGLLSVPMGLPRTQSGP